MSARVDIQAENASRPLTMGLFDGLAVRHATGQIGKGNQKTTAILFGQRLHHMGTLNITENEMKDLVDLKDQGKNPFGPDPKKTDHDALGRDGEQTGFGF